MQPLHSMYVVDDDADKTIKFEINLKALAAETHAKFVQYVQVRFDAERLAIGQVMREVSYPFGTIGLRFPEKTYKDAKAFCGETLLDNGSPNHAFHHELENADLPDADLKDVMWQMSGRPANPWRRARA